MPDLERLTRQCHIALVDLLEGEQEKRCVEAYYRGVDSARKEIAWIFLGIAVLAVIIAWLVG
jgi:hypothetical protein